LRKCLRCSYWDWKGVPESNHGVDEEDARFEEQTQDQEDEQWCGDVDAASALWVAGKNLRSGRWWGWRRSLRLEVWR